MLLSALLLLVMGKTAAAPPATFVGGCRLRLAASESGGRMSAGGGGISHNRDRVCLMAAAGEEKEEEKMELAAEVVGAVTKATVGFAVDRAAATVSEEQGLPPRTRAASQQEWAGAKRKALVGLLGNFVAFLKTDDDASPPGNPPTLTAEGRQEGDRFGGGNSADPHQSSGGGGSSRSASPPSKETVAGVMVNGYWFPSLDAAAKAPAGKGFDFAEAAANAAAEAARAKERRRKMQAAKRRAAELARPKGVDFTCGAVLLSCPARHDNSGEGVAGDDDGVLEGVRQEEEEEKKGAVRLPLWRRWTVTVLERTGLMARAQQAGLRSKNAAGGLNDGGGRGGRGIGQARDCRTGTRVEALEEPVRGPAWALLNETYRNVEARGLELVESDWDFAAIITKQLAEWKRRGVGNSYQEALLKEVIELQTRALLRPISLPAEEGSLMVQLNATYRSIEESIGRLLPKQTKEQLSLLEALVRKLDDKGIGELSFDEVYRALLLGAVPPALVTDAVRLLAAGRPGEGGGAAFLSGEAAAQAYYGRDGGADGYHPEEMKRWVEVDEEGEDGATVGQLVVFYYLKMTRLVRAQRLPSRGVPAGKSSRVLPLTPTVRRLVVFQVTLASLAARLNDTQEISRVMTYTALAAETEVIENLREVLAGLQSNIRRSLEDMETELRQPPPPSVLQGAASYANNVARLAVAVAIDGFNNASRVFDASFEALAEPSRRTLLRSTELFPWQTWHQAWTNITKGEDNLFATAEPRLLEAALDGGGGDHHRRHHSLADHGTRNDEDGLNGGFDPSALLTSGGSSRRDRGRRGAGVVGEPAVEGPGGGGARPGRRRGLKRWKPEIAAESPGSGERGGQGACHG
ncbi:unnamed protein product [Ectocarpus sp. CCAP 1310/34]|nr:unnamed protein product [Ectocarpus sp. CCAP 1310/34]